MIATLLHYITLSSDVPRSDWDKVQRLFHLEIKGKATYASWHENRSEFYRVIDEYKSATKTISHLDNQNISLVRRGQPRTSRGRISRPPQRTTNPNRFSQPAYRPPQQRQNQLFRPRPQITRQQNGRTQNRRPPNVDSAQKLRRLLCMHCSRCAGQNKYHQGPWGGGPNSNCPYNKNGQLRAGYQFLARLYGEDVCNINVEHYEDIENEGLEYETPDVNHISETNNFLIARAMGDN